MAVIFNQPVKHDRHQLMPGVPVEFADPKAEDYFVAMGWAAKTQKAPAHSYGDDEVAIDTGTINAATGRPVLGG